jgi:hypothetical protein
VFPGVSRFGFRRRPPTRRRSQGFRPVVSDGPQPRFGLTGGGSRERTGKFGSFGPSRRIGSLDSRGRSVGCGEIPCATGTGNSNSRSGKGMHRNRE